MSCHTKCLREILTSLGGHVWPLDHALPKYMHTQSMVIHILSGNYGNAGLLSIPVQGKEKVNCSLWVID